MLKEALCPWLSDDEIGFITNLATQTQARIFVYLTMVCCCITASTVTYVMVRNQQEQQFQADFWLFAEEIRNSAVTAVESRVDVMNSLSIEASSYAKAGNSQFPFVTMPNFEERTTVARRMSQSELVMLVPFFPKGGSVQTQWDGYAEAHSESWIAPGLDYQGLSHVDPGSVPVHIHADLYDDGHPSDDLLRDSVAPLWQTGPTPLNASVINFNLLSFKLLSDLIASAARERHAVLSSIDPTEFTQNFLRHFPIEGESKRLPYSFLLDPIFETPSGAKHNAMVAFHAMVIQWGALFQHILPLDKNGLEVVLSDTCGSVFTYYVRGPEAGLLGEGDLHDKEYENLRELKATYVIANTTATSGLHRDATCKFLLDIYPSVEFEETHTSNEPVLFALAVAANFVFASLVFLVYDWSVHRRQKKIASTASKTLAIVSSFFPNHFKDRILMDVDDARQAETTTGNNTSEQLQSFLGASTNTENEGSSSRCEVASKPIADLFPAATVVFADIVGFTAWSSTREPPQVFQLLEAVYVVFDKIAYSHRVFKVETVGDCYVAVAGLPEPRKDHAVAVARFAHECLLNFNDIVKALVVDLGPDTEELQLRIGIHSGPVTAGVLRGQRARFQLFGVAVNTTARMESTGKANKIQVSQDTADLLVTGGKASWLRARTDKVAVQGKGKLQTYWLENTKLLQGNVPSRHADSSSICDCVQVDTAPRFVPSASEKLDRLVEWNFDILSKLLKKVVAHRACHNIKSDPPNALRNMELFRKAACETVGVVESVVRLPKYEQLWQESIPGLSLTAVVLDQLRSYVRSVSAMHRDNAFHNFEHASHVTMAVTKLLSRISAPAPTEVGDDRQAAIQDSTFGIASDPLAHFALAFSALIHDVDHPGVPNAQLNGERCLLAVVYKNKSVSEQNSLDLAWDLLLGEQFSDLRRAIYVNRDEFTRFKQLTAKLVLTTDPDFGSRHTQRWSKAFVFDGGKLAEGSDEAKHVRATLILELLIQSSNLAHTMQHWQIYHKWNQRMFSERYTAYLAGRADADPSQSCFKDELAFFDSVAIPMAKKLKECGVLGLSSDEYLQYAVQNRKEWERRGQELVSEMRSQCQQPATSS